MTKQKLLAFLLTAILLFSAFALSACKPEQIIENDQSQPQLQTKQEQLTAALESCRTFFTSKNAPNVSVENAPTSGTETFELMLNKCTIQGMDLLGGNPIGFKGSAKFANNSIEETVSLLCAGDTVPLNIWINEKTMYFELPGVSEKPFSMPIESTANGSLPNTVDPNALLQDLTDDLSKAFSDVYDPETDLAVTEAQDGKVFSIRIDGKKLEELGNKLEAIMKELTDSFPTDLGGLGGDVLPLAADHSGDESDPDTKIDGYLIMELTMQNDAPTSFSIVAHNDDETEAASLRANASREGNTTKLDMTLKEKEETLFTCKLDMTEKENELSYELTVEVKDVKVRMSWKITKATDTGIAFEGKLELILNQNGMQVTVPMNFSGSYANDGTIVEENLQLELALTDLAEISLTLHGKTEAGEVQVTMPSDSMPFENIDADAFFAKFEEKYPNMMAFVQALLGDESGTAPDYISLDYSVQLYKEADSVSLCAIGNYSDNGSEWIFCDTDGKEIYSLPYQANSDGSYTLFGVTFDDLGDAEYTISVQYKTDTVWYTLYLDEGMGIYEINLTSIPATQQDNVYEIVLPDGSRLPYQITINGETAKIGDMMLFPYDESDVL